MVQRHSVMVAVTWIAVDVHFRRAGRWPGKDTLVQRFGGCVVLGLLNAGALGLPQLLPESQLHREDLEAPRERHFFFFLNGYYKRL